MCLCAKFIGCSVVSDDVVRTPGLFLDWHLRCESCLGFRKCHPPCRYHSLDLVLACGSDATYYIKIFLPVCFEKERDYGDTNRTGRTNETTGTNGTSASPARLGCLGCSVRPVKPLVDPLLDQRMYLRLKGTALLGIGKNLSRNAPALFRIRNNIVNDIIGVKRLDAKFVQKLGKEGFAAGNPSC